jgi:hypothetical protein
MALHYFDKVQVWGTAALDTHNKAFTQERMPAAPSEWPMWDFRAPITKDRFCFSKMPFRASSSILSPGCGTEKEKSCGYVWIE